MRLDQGLEKFFKKRSNPHELFMNRALKEFETFPRHVQILQLLYIPGFSDVACPFLDLTNSNLII